ncbi:MAG: hypothetical protein C0518_03565 [Opitutus sp.]|nr:hypothetical protein [Opitutus sp.]
MHYGDKTYRPGVVERTDRRCGTARDMRRGGERDAHRDKRRSCREVAVETSAGRVEPRMDPEHTHG